MSGDLLYAGNETCGFEGRYYMDKNNNNLDFNILFDNTDIAFVNAFLDPEILTDIKGNLSGKLKVNGTIMNPKLDGKIKLLNGNARLDLMNVSFGLEGVISADEYGFYINNMPITDQEGNTGSVIGSIYHNGFYDWNFDVVFNLEDKGIRNGFAPSRIEPLDKFLVMNTFYDKDYVYYGKGYGTGIVEISGNTENIDIDVNLKTTTGSKINFPMYGMTDIEDDENFISFKPKNNLAKINIDPKFDLTGVNLNMNFKVTPEAEIKIILDDKTEDEIFALGSGDITVAINNLRLSSR